MARYRKRPIEIEAVRVTTSDWDRLARGDSPFSEVPDWLAEAIVAGAVKAVADTEHLCWTIETREGIMTAEPGDMIIQGVKGELYPCKPDIFAATYDLVNQERGNGG